MTILEYLNSLPNPQGKIVGTTIGNQFKGGLTDIDSSPPNYGKAYGNVEISFSPDGKSFSGYMAQRQKKSTG